MNKSTNRHMNIFNSYSQNGSIPIENNISRGLAILLQEYPSLLMVLLSKINAKLQNKPIQYPIADYTVDFQRKADDFEYVSTVIGITLTSDEIECVNVDHIKANNRKYITDISIIYDDTLIFIEVKRTTENCRSQLKEQIEKYKESQNEYGDSILDYIVDFTWTEIVELLYQHQKMFDGNHGRLCDDYLNFLVNKFPAWAPIEHLNVLSADNEQAIYARLEQIKGEYIKNSSDEQLLYGRAAIRIDTDYVSECNLGYDKTFKTETGTAPCITIGMWPADTGRQYWCLHRKINRDFFDKRYSSLDIDSRSICIRIIPYVKLSHFHRGIIWLHMKETEKNYINEWMDFSNNIIGRKKEDKWDILKTEISNAKFFSMETKAYFEKEFEKSFRGKKSYVDVSCGFEVKAFIPFIEAQKLDDNLQFNELLNAYLQKTITIMAK